MFNIPKQITQGDKTTWAEKLPDYNPLTDALSCFIRGQTAVDLTGTATAEGWDFIIDSAQSETLTPGKYKTQFSLFLSLALIERLWGLLNCMSVLALRN